MRTLQVDEAMTALFPHEYATYKEAIAALQYPDLLQVIDRAWLEFIDALLWYRSAGSGVRTLSVLRTRQGHNHPIMGRSEAYRYLWDMAERNEPDRADKSIVRLFADDWLERWELGYGPGDEGDQNELDRANDQLCRLVTK